MIKMSCSHIIISFLSPTKGTLALLSALIDKFCLSEELLNTIMTFFRRGGRRRFGALISVI